MGAQPVVCRDLVELVTEFLDEALPPDLHAAVGRHLAGCVGCVEYVRQLLYLADGGLGVSVLVVSRWSSGDGLCGEAVAPRSS
jgi:hypothetical protein